MKTSAVWMLSPIALSVSTALASGALDNGQQHFAVQATYQACFTPGEDCEGMIVRAIDAASRRIHLHAYSFTDRNIARALEDASRRNLEIIVLLDKGQRNEPSAVAAELVQAGLKVMFDDRPRNRGHDIERAG